MDLEKYVEKLFKEMVYEYENKKMIQDKGIIKKTTASEFLGGLDNV